MSVTFWESESHQACYCLYHQVFLANHFLSSPQTMVAVDCEMKSL